MNLSVPEQHDYSDPTVERDPASLRAWLSDLPLMDVVETLRLVSGALRAFNEQKIDCRSRYELLEDYRSTGLRLFQTLDPMNLRQLALSRAHRQEAIDGLAGLLTGLAGGYKLVVLQLYERGQAGGSDALFGLAINRALEQLAWIQLDSFRYYRRPDSRYLAEMHALYRMARRYELLDVVCQADDVNDAPVTTAGLYHVAMLFPLTDPARLAEGEAGLLYEVLQQYASGCRMIPGNEWQGDGQGRFLIDLASGDAPEFCARLTPGAVKPADGYILDASAALSAMRMQLAKVPERVRDQCPESIVLAHLLPNDGEMRQRREQRVEQERQVRVYLGIDAVHSSLTDAAGEQQDLLCKVLDSSAAGLKLYWEGSNHAGSARVGEVVGVQDRDSPAESMQLAVVRSVQVGTDGGMVTGLELISGGCGAVHCRLPDKAEGERVRVLFMSAQSDTGNAATLLAGKGLYQQGRRLLLDVGGAELAVLAGERIFESPVVDRFTFFAERDG